MSAVQAPTQSPDPRGVVVTIRLAPELLERAGVLSGSSQLYPEGFAVCGTQ